MKFTNRERRAVTKWRELGERDFERDQGRPPDARELKEIHERAVEVVETLAKQNPDNR